MSRKIFTVLLALQLMFTGCATFKNPYTGVNPQNKQFERGMVVPPLDFFGDMLSKLHQLLFWNRNYGNHRVSENTEAMIAKFLTDRDLRDVKVSINQWAPHKEIVRLVKNPHIAWPYKLLFFPSTLIVSTIGRPLSGFLISDYYDPGSNTIHLFSDDISIALHEAGHAYDFSIQKYKGTYGLIRMVPGINLIQEANATDEAMFYLEEQEFYHELIDAPKTLYPAYATYIASYISGAPAPLIGALLMGHHFGSMRGDDIKADLVVQGKFVQGQTKTFAEHRRLSPPAKSI